MTDKKAKSIAEETAKEVKNTSAGGHVGGTYFGQEPDAKTMSTKTKKEAKHGPTTVNR